jgi:hypothetical protein
MPLQPAEPFALPDQRMPCDRPQPWEKDQRAWWAFSCAAERALQQSPSAAASRMVLQMQTWTLPDVVAFGASYDRGFLGGAKTALDRYHEDLKAMVRTLVTAPAELFDATFDPQNYVNMQSFYGKEPGSAAQAEALVEMATYFEHEYPGFADALNAVAMVAVAMQVVSTWIETTPDAGTKVAITVSSALGKMLGEEAATLASYAGSPRQLGEELGRLCGTATIEVALLTLGF